MSIRGYQLGQKIRAMRELLCITRAEFAVSLNMPETTLKNYENGYRETIPATLLIDICMHKKYDMFTGYLMNPAVDVDKVGLYI